LGGSATLPLPGLPLPPHTCNQTRQVRVLILESTKLKIARYYYYHYYYSNTDTVLECIGAWNAPIIVSSTCDFKIEEIPHIISKTHFLKNRSSTISITVGI
jgi:hypothetical protein